MAATPIRAYIDGASSGNPGPAGLGVVFQDAEGQAVASLSKGLGPTTNNIAEYLALVYCLHEALRRGIRVLAVRTDSELLARQFNGRYQVRDATLRLLHQLARHMAAGFDQLRVEHVSRTQNGQADRLAKQAARHPTGSTAAGGRSDEGSVR